MGLRMMKKLASTIVLEQLLWCGGEQKSLKQIYDELIAEGYERKYVDFYLFCLTQYQPETKRDEE
jgi:hypothetical protein